MCHNFKENISYIDSNLFFVYTLNIKLFDYQKIGADYMEVTPLKIGNLQSKLPVIQGGMGIGISLSKLAGTVAALGGVGVISGVQIGFKEEDFKYNTKEANFRALKEEIRKAREMAPDGIIGVNLMFAMNNYDEMVLCAAESGADLIISGAGLPLHLPKLLKGYKAYAVPIISSKRACDILLKHWYKKYDYIPPLIVLEGPLAGGHLGFSKEDVTTGNVTLEGILKEVLEVRDKYEALRGEKISLVAGGGLYSKEDVDKILSLGADGVQIATRFVATEECDAPLSFKMAYVNCKADDIVIVKSPVGLPGRAIKNPFLERVKLKEEGREDTGLNPNPCLRCLKECNPSEIPYCITKALVNSATSSADDGLVFTGGSAYKIQKIVKVKEILNELFGMNN